MNAKTSKRVCTVCGIRPIGGGKSSGYEDVEYNQQQGFCNPCGDEGQMSNSHLNGHEAIAEAECWFCHPELDETQKPYVARTGTSREGMTMVVPLRASGVDKATTVKAQLPKGSRSKITEEETIHGVAYKTVLAGKANGKTFEGHWDHRGRWTGGKVEGRKVRNASELLRVLAA